jgi:hypothetical protein
MNDRSLRHDAPSAHGGTGLKILVIVMGLMIAAGVAVLGYTIIARATSGAIGTGTNFATAGVTLPAGSRALSMGIDGDTAVLLVEEPGGRRSIVTIDRRSGAILGTVTLEAR